jgi:hypothetical protein
VPEDFPYFYQAVGTRQGIFCIDPFRLQSNNTTLPLFVPKKWQDQLSPNQEVTLGVYLNWGRAGLSFQVYSVKKRV